MKVLAIAALAVGLGVGAVSYASSDDYKHRDEGKHHSPEKMVERMSGKLDLTEEQKEQMLSIMEAQHEKMKATREAMKASRQEMKESMMAVLNEEQKEQFEKMKHREKGKHGEKHYGEKHHGDCDDE